MSDDYTPTLQEIAAARDWWSADAGEHYRELAHWLRGIAAKCRLPHTQKELLDLARRYETRADRISLERWLAAFPTKEGVEKILMVGAPDRQRDPTAPSQASPAR
jgi:hypothetical protein